MAGVTDLQLKHDIIIFLHPDGKRNKEVKEIIHALQKHGIPFLLPSESHLLVDTIQLPFIKDIDGSVYSGEAIRRFKEIILSL